MSARPSPSTTRALMEHAQSLANHLRTLSLPELMDVFPMLGENIPNGSLVEPPRSEAVVSRDGGAVLLVGEIGFFHPVDEVRGQIDFFITVEAATGEIVKVLTKCELAT